MHDEHGVDLEYTPTLCNICKRAIITQGMLDRAAKRVDEMFPESKPTPLPEEARVSVEGVRIESDACRRLRELAKARLPDNGLDAYITLSAKAELRKAIRAILDEQSTPIDFDDVARRFDKIPHRELQCSYCAYNGECGGFPDGADFCVDFEWVGTREKPAPLPDEVGESMRILTEIEDVAGRPWIGEAVRAVAGRLVTLEGEVAALRELLSDREADLEFEHGKRVKAEGKLSLIMAALEPDRLAAILKG